MEVIGICGSPRHANTEYMIKEVLEATESNYQIIHLADKNIYSCTGCKTCHQNYQCKIDDDMQDIYSKLKDAKGIVLGSPTYFDNVSGIMKNFMDRCLPFWAEGFSQDLSGKRVGLVTSANFENYVEFDKNGNCKYHEEETQSALKCLSALEDFSRHIGFEIIGKVYALHSDPHSKKDELVGLGKKLILKE